MNVRVGLGVCIFKDDKVLLGCRKGSHGENTWSFPGGHLEFNESWDDCAIRETKEETNIEIENIKLMGITNDIFKNENKHYITIFMKANYKKGELTLMEPNKCEKWQWFDPNNLPSPLFLPLKNYISEYGKIK
ncbi:MAG: NUDIX hydrolase [Bacilli bacterium]|nr:NUDIX hydrolase [Bacilli bacterium]